MLKVKVVTGYVIEEYFRTPESALELVPSLRDSLLFATLSRAYALG